MTDNKSKLGTLLYAQPTYRENALQGRHVVMDYDRCAGFPIPVRVFTADELRELVKKCYTDGVRMQGGLALSVSEEEIEELFKELEV